MVFILCSIILTKFFINNFFQFFKTLLIPVPLPHHFLLVTIYCNSRIIQINGFEQHSLPMPFNSDYYDIQGVYIFCRFDLLWKSFQGFTLWTPTKAPLWIFCGAYSTLRTSYAFYNIQKLNFTSKTENCLDKSLLWEYWHAIGRFLSLKKNFHKNFSLWKVITKWLFVTNLIDFQF